MKTKTVTMTVKLEVDECVDVEEMVAEMDYSFEYEGLVGSTIVDYEYPDYKHLHS
jgi:DNA-dependent RNA polymerase auxiliary subunit epsilon